MPGALAFVLVLALVAGACSATDNERAGGATSSTRQSPVRPVARPGTPAPPGTVIESTEIQPPDHARAWRVDYHSRNISGTDIGVRMLLVVPMVEPPPGGFPVIAWGHPTKGGADDCAPSIEGAASIPLIETLLREGYAVAATDYEGLAAEGPHPYLVGDSEAHSMLDAVRAAAQVKGSNVKPGSPVILWGFSQGGHAALFAAQRATDYAPDLHILGVGVASPVSDVDHFVRRAESWPAQFGVLVSIVYGFKQAYPELDLSKVLTPAAMADLDRIETGCITEITDLYNRPIEQSLVVTPRALPEFSALFAANLAGNTAVRVPVLVVQGVDDQIIDVADTDALSKRLCGQKVPVQYVRRPGENHAVRTDDVLLPWARALLVGQAPPSNC